MSRCDFNDDPDYENAGDLYAHNVDLALSGKRGKKALADLKAALEALPEKKLIEDALSKDHAVCAVGAYLWHKRVKAGMDPVTAFESLPENSGEGGTPEYETVDLAASEGLTRTLAWELIYRNDEDFGRLTPEQRYDRYLAWIDEQLARPLPQRSPPKPPKRLSRAKEKLASWQQLAMTATRS